MRSEFGEIIGKDSGFLAGAGDGDVAEARIEQVRMDAGVGVHEDALGGEALRAVAGDGVAVVKVAMLSRIELDLSA